MIPDLNYGAMAAASLWFLVLFGLSMILRQKGFQTESTRKLVHIGGGSATLFFPWVFHTLWEATLLCLAFAGLLLWGKTTSLMDGVHQIRRISHGAFLFPPAILLTLAYGKSEPLFCTAALGVLSYADALAALVGQKWGKWKLSIHEGRKTVEGCIAFGIAAFTVLSLCLILGSDLNLAKILLISAYAALILSLLELIAWRGWDNLILPLMCLYILQRISTKSTEVVLADLSLLSLCLGVFLIGLRGTRLAPTARLALGLASYGAWRLMDWPWALPLLGAALLYKYARMGKSRPGHLQVAPIFWGLSPLLLWIFWGNQNYGQQNELWVRPYTLSCAILLSIASLREAQIRKISPGLGAVCGLGLGGLCSLMCLYYSPIDLPVLFEYGQLLLGMIAAMLIEYFWQKRRLALGLERAKHWILRAGLYALVASSLETLFLWKTLL